MEAKDLSKAAEIISQATATTEREGIFDQGLADAIDDIRNYSPAFVRRRAFEGAGNGYISDHQWEMIVKTEPWVRRAWDILSSNNKP